MTQQRCSSGAAHPLPCVAVKCLLLCGCHLRRCTCCRVLLSTCGCLVWLPSAEPAELRLLCQGTLAPAEMPDCCCHHPPPPSPPSPLCSISAQPELKPLRVALAAFLRRSVGPWLAAKQPGQGGLSAEQLGELLRRLRGAERALGSSAA